MATPAAQAGNARTVARPATRYGYVAMTLHWLLAVLLVAAFVMGLTMVDMPGITPGKLRLFNWHKWLGVTVFTLATVRLFWRLTHPAPPLAPMSRWQWRAAAATHCLLYLLMLAVPLAGYFYSLASGFPVVWLEVVPLPVLMEPNAELKPLLRGLHYWLNMGLAILVLLHVGAAVKHHFIDRDGLLWRMLPGHISRTH